MTMPPRRRIRRSAQVRRLSFEPLEDRRVLASLTLIERSFEAPALGVSPQDVSYDGSVVTGVFGSGGESFYWTEADRMQVAKKQIPEWKGDVEVVAISGDGNVIVGRVMVDGYAPFRWDRDGNARSLGAPNDQRLWNGFANAASRNGSVIVGCVVLENPTDPGSRMYGFKWTEGGYQMLPNFSTGAASNATSVSGDGSVIVGVMSTGSTQHVFKWDGKQGLVDLQMVGSAPLSEPLGPLPWHGRPIVSPSGEIVISGAYWWTQKDGWQLAASPAGAKTFTLDDVADDGTMIGTAFYADRTTASVIWTNSSSPMLLKDYLANFQGLAAELEGWFPAATAISGDGGTIVGVRSLMGLTDPGWIVHLDAETVEQFELLAREAAYMDWNVGQQVVTAHLTSDYVVDAVFTDADRGFYAIGLKSLTMGPALVFRGSAEPIDFWDDSDPRGVGYREYIVARSAILEWVRLQNEPVDLTGHSLGGALAQWFAASVTKATGSIDNLVTFNSPGISNSRFLFPHLLVYADDFKRNRSVGILGVRHYVASGDIVSLAGERFVDGDVIVTFSDEMDWFIDLHTFPMLVPETQDNDGSVRKRPVDLAFSALISAQMFSSPLYHYERDVDLFWIDLTSSLSVWLNAEGNVGLRTPGLELLNDLRSRATVELLRVRVGHLLRGTGIFSQQVTGDQISLTVLAADAYRNLKLVFERPTMGTPSQSGLQFKGNAGVAIAGEAAINLPGWLGGDFRTDYIASTSRLGFSTIKHDSIESEGSFSLLGQLAVLSGSSLLDYSNKELRLAGKLSVLNDFVVDNAAFGKVSLDGSIAFSGSNGTVTFPDVAELPSYMRGTKMKNAYYVINFDNDQDYTDDFVAAWGEVDGVPMGLVTTMDGDWFLLSQSPVNAGESGEGEEVQDTVFSFSPEAASAVLTLEWSEEIEPASIVISDSMGRTIYDNQSHTGNESQSSALSNATRVVLRWKPEGAQATVRISGGAAKVTVYEGVAAPLVEIDEIAQGDGVMSIKLRSDLTTGRHLWMFRRADEAGGFSPATVSTLGAREVDWKTAGLNDGEYQIAALSFNEGKVPTTANWSSSVAISSPLPHFRSVVLPDLPITFDGTFSVAATVDHSLSAAGMRILINDELVTSDLYGADGWGVPVYTGGRTGSASLTVQLLGQGGQVVDQVMRPVFFAGAMYWQNPINHFDTNADGFVSPIDVLLVINLLNRVGGGAADTLSSLVDKMTFLDTSGDDFYSPIDALVIINYLNGVEAEGERVPTEDCENRNELHDAFFAEAWSLGDIGLDFDGGLASIRRKRLG